MLTWFQMHSPNIRLIAEMDFDKDGEFDVAIEWNGILSF